MKSKGNLMQRNPVGWFEIYVQDIQRAKSFYESVFQHKLEKLDTPANLPGSTVELWAFPMNMNGGGASGALVKMEGMPSRPGGTLVYFSCADCAVEAERAKEAAGAVYKEKMSIGQYGFIALITDTEGNMVGLHSMQ
jgi:uncharacterized protein